MDCKGRPKIKDLKARYNYDGFFLTTHETLGSCVCLWETKRANEIIRSLRKRGYLCVYQDGGLGGSWYIQTKEA